MNVVPFDFAKRRSMHQTMRDRKRLQAAQAVAMPVAEQSPASRVHHEAAAARVMVDQKRSEQADISRSTLKAEFRGGFTLGFAWGVGLWSFFWLLNLWVTAGGAS